MKFKKLIGKITAFVLAGTMMLGNVPVYADTAANSGADVFATQSSNFTIRIPKQLVLSGNEGTGAYRVAVKGNISGTDIITVTPDAEFYMKQEGKSDILATITQPKTNFTYADGVRPETEVISDGVIEMASISAGKWSGLFNFTVTSSVDLSLEDSIGSDKADINGSVIGDDVSQDKHSEYDVITSETRTPIKVTATNSDGVDINASASTIVGSEAKKLLDSLNESGLIEDTEEVDALIEVESDDFEGIADTTFDVSDIANSGDTVVILHFDEEKQMWEHIGTETVDENGKVNGDFTSYSPVAFVKKENDGTLTTHYHDFEEFVQEPTCTQDGIKTYTCKDYCGYITTEFIDPLGHDYKTSSTASSCTEEGYTTYTCERCGDSYVDNTVPAFGHNMKLLLTRGNCEEGTLSKYYSCTVCGTSETKKESITPQPHDMKLVSIEGNCEQGTVYKDYKCTICGTSEMTASVPLKHTYGEWEIIKEATCTEEGSKQRTCTVCGYTMTENGYGHNMELISASGNCEEVVHQEYKCTICGQQETKTLYPLPASHHYGDWVITKEANCTEEGEKQKTCSVCNNVVAESIDILGHNYNNYSSNETQHWKDCTNCCGITTAKDNHNDSDTDGLCDICKYKGTIVYTYHNHSGDSSLGTGCYTTANYTTCGTYSDILYNNCETCQGTKKITSSCISCGGDGQGCDGRIPYTNYTGKTETYYDNNCSTCNAPFKYTSYYSFCERCGEECKIWTSASCTNGCGFTSSNLYGSPSSDGYVYHKYKQQCYVCSGTGIADINCDACNGSGNGTISGYLCTGCNSISNTKNATHKYVSSYSLSCGKTTSTIISQYTKFQ